jgi:hypothetical protein
MPKMSIPQSTASTTNIQSKPDVVVGQPVEIKTAFDQYAIDDKNYTNNTLIPSLNGNNGSKMIGHSSANFTADNVSDGLEELKQDLQDVTQGAVADGSITDQKLSNNPNEIKDRVLTIQSSLVNFEQIKGSSTIPTTGWVVNSGVNTIKLNIPIANVTTNTWVDIVIDKESHGLALDAEINPTIVEYDGGITLFANTAPVSAIPFTYKITKVVGAV